MCRYYVIFSHRVPLNPRIIPLIYEEKLTFQQTWLLLSLQVPRPYCLLYIEASLLEYHLTDPTAVRTRLGCLYWNMPADHERHFSLSVCVAWSLVMFCVDVQLMPKMLEKKKRKLVGVDFIMVRY